MSSDTKMPAPETSEQQQIAPQTGELDAEQLDEVVGGNLGSGSGLKTPPPPPVG